MITKTKKVYYCEFCKKKGLSASALATHEKHCTGNLNRHRRMCGNTRDYKALIRTYTERIEKEIPVLIDGKTAFYFAFITTQILPPSPLQEKVDKIQDDIVDSVNGCPACTLTILRKLDPIPGLWNYDYKEEVRHWWATQAEVNYF